MKRKTPPGFYFVLLVALLSFVYCTGLTRLPKPGQDIASPLVSPGHDRIGVYVTSHALTKPSILEAIHAAREAGQIDTLVINVKNMHGELTYASSVSLADEINAATGRLDLPMLLDELRARGFYLIARQVVFFDPLLAQHLGFEGSWVPADSRMVCDYNLAVASEVAGLGFDELQFDYIRYPDGGELKDIYEDRFTAIAAFLSEAHDLLGDRIPLSADLFGRVMWPWNSGKIDPIGQSLEDMAPYLDFISPMVYPSHYFEQLPDGMALETYINEQIQAAQDYGADGYLFWHPACEYEPLFRVLAPALN